MAVVVVVVVMLVGEERSEGEAEVSSDIERPLCPTEGQHSAVRGSIVHEEYTGLVGDEGFHSQAPVTGAPAALTGCPPPPRLPHLPHLPPVQHPRSPARSMPFRWPGTARQHVRHHALLWRTCSSRRVEITPARLATSNALSSSAGAKARAVMLLMLLSAGADADSPGES